MHYAGKSSAVVHKPISTEVNSVALQNVRIIHHGNTVADLVRDRMSCDKRLNSHEFSY